MAPHFSTSGAVTKLSYSEKLPSLVEGVNIFRFNPRGSGLKKLDQIGRGYDHFIVKSATVRYKTSVGTTKDGHVFIGIDYGSRTVPANLDDVTALHPRVDGPVWENYKLDVEIAKAMTKKIMECGSSDPDNTPFVVACHTAIAASGVIWVDYEVEFQSPVASDATSQGEIRGVADFILQSATAVEIPIGTASTEAVISDRVNTNIDPITRVMTSDFHESSADAGQNFSINSVGDAVHHGNAANMVVTFKDAVTGQPLPNTVVKPLRTVGRVNNIFTSIWQFVKPWVRPFIVNVVETLLSNNDAPTTHESRHILSTDPIGSIHLEPPSARPYGDVAIMARVPTASTPSTILNGYSLEWVITDPNVYTLTKVSARPPVVGDVVMVSLATGNPDHTVSFTGAAGSTTVTQIWSSGTNQKWYLCRIIGNAVTVGTVTVTGGTTHACASTAVLLGSSYNSTV